MTLLAILLLLAIAVLLGSFLFLVVAAFRVHPGWGLGTLFVPLVGMVFAIVHWQQGGKRFLAVLFSSMAIGAIATSMILTDPRMLAAFKKGYEASRARRGYPVAKVNANAPASRDPHAPHEVRDLAENEAPSTAAPPVTVDPNAAARAALARHGADLNALYNDLNKERATLKKGSPAVAAFNAKAAKYQDGLRNLAAEQAQLDALDHPAAAAASLAQAAASPATPGGSKEAEAAAALARLRAAAAQGDYAGFAGTLKKCLSDYRQTAAFPQIAATARGTLANATPDKLTAAVQAQGAAARGEMETAMSRVRVIVNQTPPTVPKPPASADTYYSEYHPGALRPDFAHADLYSTRELMQGEYVYIQHVPNVYYRSADCEFNPQTKFFITSRDVPKKKLTDVEMAEVVRLYRLIAADERLIAAIPQHLQDAQAASVDLLALNKQLAASR